MNVAAGLLRNYLEFISAELRDRLGARVEYRLDGRMELGHLLQAAYGRIGDLLKSGKIAANSWGQADKVDTLNEKHDELKEAWTATRIDQWQTNAAIHYNSWASLQKEDFEPLVASFKRLIDAFRCVDCDGFLKVVRDGANTKSVSCNCGIGSFNLEAKG